MTYVIGDVVDVLPTLHPARFQCCVTSPPYWGLRGLAWLKETHAADVEAVVAELHRRGVSLDTIDAPAEVTNSAEPLHVVDQEGQPYGSTRRCCNMCGTALFHDMRYVATCAEWHRRRVRGEPTCADVVSGAG